LKSFLTQLFLLIVYGGITQGLFIVLLLGNKGFRSSRANVFLSILLMTLAFSTAHILFAGAVINHISAEVYSVGDPTFYLIAPLLWFYVLALTGERVKWRGSLLLHFIPFFLIIFFSLSVHGFHSPSFLSFLNAQHKVITIFFWVTVVVQFSWYQVLVHRRWTTYQRLVEQEVSSTENVSIAWVRFFMIVFLLINILFLFSLFAAIHFKEGSWLPLSTALTFSLSIFALGYKGILQREVFGNEVVDGKHSTEESVVKEKPDQHKLDKLVKYMDEKKPYLDAELTLTELAKGLNITRTQLSSLINEGTGNNFYDFINKYRVEEVKRLMVDPTMKNYNMLGLALEAGFKSKSTFNLIFKRFTGLTPSEYRKNLSS
jgi:AraC-like DNA-binding protein